MPIAARSNTPGVARSYQNDVVLTTVYTHKDGSTQTVQTLASPYRHGCFRSAIVKSPLITVPGTRTRIRTSRSYDRYVWDAVDTQGERRIWQKAPTPTSREYVQTTESLSNVSVSDIDILSGGYISGHVISARTAEINEARVKALNKFVDMKVNIGTALAESRQTLDMLADSSVTLLRAIIALKRRDWKALQRLLGLSYGDVVTGKQLANGWLQYQYGWRPLMQDIKGTYDLLMEKKERSLNVSSSGAGFTNHNFSGKAKGNPVSGKVKVHYSCHLKARVKTAYLQQLTSVGLLNPASLAWEVVPLSFVIDWFAPVGKCLEAFSATAGLTFVDGYEGVHGEASVNVTGVNPLVDSSESRTLSYSPPSLTARWFRYRRTALGAFPSVGLYNPMKDTDKHRWFDSAKVASALALIRQSL